MEYGERSLSVFAAAGEVQVVVIVPFSLTRALSPLEERPPLPSPAAPPIGQSRIHGAGLATVGNMQTRTSPSPNRAYN